MRALVLKHDPEGTMTYGFFRCQDCGSAMYGGGPFIHRKGCERSGYDGLEYHLGDAAIERILSGQGHLNPIEADELRQHLPEDCARIEAARPPEDVPPPGPASTSGAGISQLLAPFAARGRQRRRA